MNGIAEAPLMGDPNDPHIPVLGCDMECILKMVIIKGISISFMDRNIQKIGSVYQINPINGNPHDAFALK